MHLTIKAQTFFTYNIIGFICVFTALIMTIFHLLETEASIGLWALMIIFFSMAITALVTSILVYNNYFRALYYG